MFALKQVDDQPHPPSGANEAGLIERLESASRAFFESPVAKAAAEVGDEALKISAAALKTKAAKSILGHAVVGAAVAVPVPLVGPVFGATVGAAVGAYREITKKN